MSGARGDLIEARVRSWFLRNALDSLERVQGAEARERISAGIPKRLSPLIARERLRLASAIDAVNLQDAEDVLFSIDASLGHGAGTSMEDVAMHVVTRAVSEGSASLSESDLAGSVLRLRSMLESPFVDVPVLFELTRTPEGFTLAVGVAGRPRATRLLRHYATGAIRAAWRLMRDAPATEPRISAESIADRAFISVVLRDGTSENAPASRARSKPVGRPSGPVTGLVAEVERILGSRLENGTSDLPRRDSSYPPKRASDRPSRPD
ncbi:MAG: hypothetical protein ACOY0T_36830 [Myxococcota bacterium]